jgi:hypothetical protein
MPWLQRRGGVVWFRKMVPHRLRPILKKREVRESLHTGDMQTAKRRAIAVAAKVERIFAEAEAALSNPTVATYRMLQEDAEERARRPRTDDEEEAESLAITEALQGNNILD